MTAAILALGGEWMSEYSDMLLQPALLTFDVTDDCANFG
jgi:hypothetical protein